MKMKHTIKISYMLILVCIVLTGAIYVLKGFGVIESNCIKKVIEEHIIIPSDACDSRDYDCTLYHKKLNIDGYNVTCHIPIPKDGIKLKSKIIKCYIID